MVYGDRAFVKFLVEISRHVDQLTIIGRLEAQPGTSRYALPPSVSFVDLPYYTSLAHANEVMRELFGAAGRFWGVLDDVDVVWLMGPHPFALVFALLASIRRRRVALGVRQDLPRYVRSRHPTRRSLHFAAVLLETAFRMTARRTAVIAVGPDLAHRYRRARRLLQLHVSMISKCDVLPAEADERRYDGELRVLSVGRIEAEKNPLLLASVLADLQRRSQRWQLVVCGEGPMSGPLRARLEELGVSDRAELLGYVPIDKGLLDHYRDSHLFLHVSWTEGLPQVLFEAFAARLPTVATAVGGVPAAAGDAALLVPPGDPVAAAAALEQLASDAELRRRLVEAGARRAASHTIEAEAAQLVAFLADAGVGGECVGAHRTASS